ncbi:MAG: glycerophosphodiester phosphodiesterase [Rubrobacter sp.]|nr:glycerophosphodiester phosphodiesterase [Rubrobacter sp.]
MNRKWLVVCVLAGFAGLLALLTLRKGEARQFSSAPGKGWPVNVAHRGASAQAPENTLEAFRAAEASGAGGLELDVHITRDGEAVVIHDSSLNRTTDGAGLVREKTLQELRSFDAGYRFTGDGGQSYPHRDRKVRMPTLGEVLEEFPGVTVNIEIKEAPPGGEGAVLEAIERAGAEDRVLVAAERLAVIERFREVSGGRVATAASRREIATFYLMSRLRLEGLLRPRYQSLQVPVDFGRREIVTPRFVEAAHGRGVRVDVWTINDAPEMQRLLDLGVDSIMTDRPAVMSEVLEGR